MDTARHHRARHLWQADSGDDAERVCHHPWRICGGNGKLGGETVKALFAALFLLLAGPGLLWAGVQSLRCGYWRDSVPLLEVILDRIGGAEPPPRNIWDRRFAYAQAWFHIVIGSVFSLFLTLILFSFFPE